MLHKSTANKRRIRVAEIRNYKICRKKPHGKIPFRINKRKCNDNIKTDPI
jgi:hypothetical protein